MLDSLVRYLVERGATEQPQAVRLREQLDTAFLEATVPVAGTLVHCLGNHPGDRHVLETSLVARAEFLVTDNVRHFEDEHLAPVGQAAVTPDAFLAALYRERPQVLTSVLREMSDRYRTRRLSPGELVEVLRPRVPRTMGLLSSFE